MASAFAEHRGSLGASKNTVTKLLVELGSACSEYMDGALRNLTCKRIQVDEVWWYVGAKDKNVLEEKKDHFGTGSLWTWTAIDADTKLIPSWRVGSRDAGVAGRSAGIEKGGVRFKPIPYPPL